MDHIFRSPAVSQLSRSVSNRRKKLVVADTACGGLCGLGVYIFIFPGDSAKHGRALPGDSLYCTRACAVVFLVVDSAPEEGRAKLNGDGYRFYPVKRAVR